MFLKVMHDAGGSPEHPGHEFPYSLYADVTECHFRRFEPKERIDHVREAFGEALVRVREPIKTADVAGFVENEKNIVLGGNAYLMNEQGRTISKFTAPYEEWSPQVAPGSAGDGRNLTAGKPDIEFKTSDEEQEAISWLKVAPYKLCAQIRRSVGVAVYFNGYGRELLATLDRAGVAVDA